MADIFISYAHEDQEKARRLAEALAGQGWSVWWDTRLKAGEVWDEVIERELDAARCIVVLWSRMSVGRHWVRVEASEGLERQILVPAFIEDVRPPLAFRRIQAEHLIDWSGDPSHLGLNRLLVAVAERLRAQSVKEVSRQPVAEAMAVAVTPRKKRQALERAEKSARGDAQLLHEPAGFRNIDAPWCPEMVVIPHGTFLMGSPGDEGERSSYEGPQHRVTIGYRFAIGRYPVTFQQYDHFCAATNLEKPDDQGWGRGRQPVIEVSWRDVQAYCEWLSRATGQAYRLPSEAEWEYACRAGTTTRFACGDEITEQEANFGNNVGKTTEVGAYPANPWGLYDMHGNVWEWVEDVWHDSYSGAPADGSAWTDGEGKESSRARVLRGGSWYCIAGNCRSAHRNRDHPDYRYYGSGFRVARTLD
jgi:formylglycine-generating enzyme required for sulfatase activity